MGEIKFRGKSDDDWVYGMLLKINPCDCGEHGEFKDNKYMIQTDELLEIGEYCKYFITNDDSVGQYTGLHDKNGKEIYEGDIVNMHYFFENYDPSTLGAFEDEAEETGIIKINEYGVYLENKKREIFYLVNYVQEPEEELEVLGNIYKNKELLNETNR